MRNPSYRLHKATSQAYVELNGRRIYLGRYDNPKSLQKYHEVVAEWVANGRQSPSLACPSSPPSVTITDVCETFVKHAELYYRDPQGRHTSSLVTFNTVTEALKLFFGPQPAAEFGPKALRILREHWIRDGLARITVNGYVKALKHIFKWAVSHELVPPMVHHALSTVEGLRYGRSEARETKPIQPAPHADIDAARVHMTKPVRALVDLQLLTCARPGELLKLRPIDFNKTEAVWTVVLQAHKTAYKGRRRVLYFGPKAQEILLEFMEGRPVAAYLFSPKESEAERYVKAETHRRPNQKQNVRKTERTLGDHYTPASYRRAVEYACKKAKVTVWTPYQLRHNAATEIRKKYGLDCAQVLLGHASANITQVYAEVDEKKAVEIVCAVG